MKYLFLILFSLNICLSYSQQSIGYHYDASGAPLYDYFDQLTYKPKDNIYITYNSTSFEPGYYYSHDGTKHIGKIKFAHKKIWFKESKTGVEAKLKTDEVNSFVVGIDSFCLVRNFLSEDELVTENEFAQVIADFNNVTVLKHIYIRRDMMGKITAVNYNFLVRKIGEDTWKSLSDKKRFKEIALQYFSDNEFVKTKILNEDFNKENIISLVKTSEYLFKARTSQPLYFNAYWQEINKPYESKYVGLIKHAHDSIWDISYFQGDSLLYKISYSSFYPNNRNGIASAFFLNGEVRKEINFSNDSVVGVKEYMPGGLIKLDYNFITNKSDSRDDNDSFNVQYNAVSDSTRKIINVRKGEYISAVKDTAHNLNYYRKFIDGGLHESYRLQGADTVFQIVDPEFDLRLEKLQKRVSNGLSDYDSFNEASKLNAQGYVLVKFVINQKGYAESYELLNNLTSDVDKWVEEFIKDYINGEDYTQFKFRTFKKGKTKHKYEVVIPFDFSINRLYRKPWNYYNYNWHWHHYHHQQMMHQMHMQNIQQIQQQQMQQMNNMRMSAPSHF